VPDDARLADVDAQPELKLARAQESIAATEAELAGAARLPDWSAEVSYAFRGSPYSNMVSLMFSIDLPWSPGTRQDREHAAKLKELDAARAMREDARRMRSAEVQSMLIEWQSARAQAQRIRTELLPLTVQRREAALAAYRGGTGALAAVLDARRAELDAELALITQEQSIAKAWAFLNFVVPGTEGS
jgi:outer membrane protein TolC